MNVIDFLLLCSFLFKICDFLTKNYDLKALNMLNKQNLTSYDLTNRYAKSLKFSNICHNFGCSGYK